MDSDSQDSDEGVVLTQETSLISELYPGETQEQPILEAKLVYILMPKDVPISRVNRLQWLLDHLNSVLTLPTVLNTCSSDLQVISTIPTANQVLVTSKTEVIFLAQSYRFIYCLDMSPSLATIDIDRGGILLDEVLECFKRSLEGLCKQFVIPGNTMVFYPCIYLTVIVNTPFFMSPAQQVLVKGVQVTTRNINDIVLLVETQFKILEGRIAHVSALAHDQMDQQKAESEGMVGGLFDLPETKQIIPNIPMVLPDANFVNMLRYSMLAIALLPENSLSHILVITDGIVAMPDSNIMESLLFQLHFDSIALSFIRVGSPFHPNSSAAYIPYNDLLYFLSESTLGCCIKGVNYIKETPTAMNIYHELFLLWSFCPRSRIDCIERRSDPANEIFYGNRAPPLLSKRQTEEKINASILLLLARRMREGYVVDNLSYVNGYLEIKLTLLWKHFIYMHYKLTSQWPVSKNAAHFEVLISAPYEFLHDITCLMKKESKSSYRQALIERFWIRITQLATSDSDLAQLLTSIPTSNVWYTLPESVRSGIPVFILNSIIHDACKLVLTPSDVSCPKFFNFWQPISQMETNSWRKWFHTQKLSLILKHDHPLPKHLHLANSSGRFQVVQCRQAATALYGMLANWASFVLIDNHTYLKFLYSEVEKPFWFCIVRVSSKFPCAVLNIGFLTGTSGLMRQKVCGNLKEKLAALSYHSSPPNSKENACCTLLQKPLEKFLIRYERMPSDFTTVIFPDGTQPPQTLQTLPKSPFAGTLFTTLSRYLYHKRWIWSATHSTYLKLDYSAISRILSTLTRMRIKEGFNIAHSSSGIITMVLELPMDSDASCVMQYVLFPPHNAFWGEELCSGSEEDAEPDPEVNSELQMVTEVWIEPQYGAITSSNSRISYMDNKQYYELADVISQVDLSCIHSLLTLEHLSLMCQDKRKHRLSLSSRIGKNMFLRTSTGSLVDYSPSIPDNGSQWNSNSSQRIHHIPFKFDPFNILELCQMTELLFSMFIEARNNSEMQSNNLFMENILHHMQIIHDHELDMTQDESARITTHILTRHKNHCPISESAGQWRCFVKGMSVTHVILTLVPAALNDLKLITSYEGTNIFYDNDSRNSSRISSNSDGSTNPCPTLPIYVFDCPLSLLLDTYVNNNKDVTAKDVYEDYTNKSRQEDLVRLIPSISPEPKSEESESNEAKSSAKQHCSTLICVHTKCFTVSLFMALHQELFIHYLDVQTAMEHCEETVEEIDITEFILSLCGHLKHRTDQTINIKDFEYKSTCIEVRYLQEMIQKRFFDTVKMAFNPIPSKSEFYFCRNLNAEQKLANGDSEDDNELDNSKDDKPVVDFNPLFLHFTHTLKYNNMIQGSKQIKYLPTCAIEVLWDYDLTELDKTKLKVVLDIVCLTLPVNIQSLNSEINLPVKAAATDTKLKEIEKLAYLNDLQQQAVISLQEELQWLLKDEIVTSLLDVQPVTTNTLTSIMKHIATNSRTRRTCILDVIILNFVFDCKESHEKFVSEFVKLSIPNYKICKEGDIYYLAKEISSRERQESGCFVSPTTENPNKSDRDDSSQSSDDSSQAPSEGGYEEDISENDEDYDWIFRFENRRPCLPNFWLIMQIEKKAVTIYYHCRFIELSAEAVKPYLNIQRTVGEAIRDLCKKVNQSMLLQSLDDTRKCNYLLEPEESVNDWHIESTVKNISRNSSYMMLKSMEEGNDDYEIFMPGAAETSLRFRPGYFTCPVVWETHFVLHPRLKIGPGKPGISRGILALKNILEKFSVTNRDNMFVYKDNNFNVFYLRLHENLQSGNNKMSSIKSGEMEHTTVSRSPSIASLPLGQKSSFPHSEQFGTTSTSGEVRPRVRSFGEKESSEPSVEDTLILRVHGINEAGQDVKCDLVQVLQNRLDDAVLEFLSIMLARNAMCPLTPEDVHFLQKPFRLPEIIIKLSIQDFALKLLDAFQHYLRQNLLQFLNVPKYTDARPRFHFTDYSESEQIPNKTRDDCIFIYNQSQNPSSGSRGIACIALAIMNHQSTVVDTLKERCDELFRSREFEEMVASRIIQQNEKLPDTYLEFRLWKQGRVNIDNLSQKLKNATSQAIWDIIMEYYLLRTSLCDNVSLERTEMNKLFNSNVSPILEDTNKEFELSCLLDLHINSTANIEIQAARNDRRLDKKLDLSNLFKKQKKKCIPLNSTAQRSITFEDTKPIKKLIKLNSFELGDSGVLSQVYANSLPDWLEFGCDLVTPAVRKHKVMLTSRHLTNVTIREVLALVQQLTRENPKAFKRLIDTEGGSSYVPCIPVISTQKCIVLSRNFEQWKACIDHSGSLDFPELFNTNNLKHMQKFTPGVLPYKFIPRQKIFWANIESEQITFYTYNWSKDNMDKLLDSMTNLGLWLSVRSSLLNSVIAQKLGLFHNQSITRKPFLPINNPFVGMIGEVDHMMKFTKDRSRRIGNAGVNSPTVETLEAFRDCFKYKRYTSPDPVIVSSIEIHDMKHTDKKSRDELKKLHAMYQKRATSSNLHQINLVLQNSRVIHFCHTPLLFLPRWRLKSAATRDHSLAVDNDYVNFISNPRTPNETEQWHDELCSTFLSEYRRYLQTLGFMPLQIDLAGSKKALRGTKQQDLTVYNQKAILGGILMFTMQLREPFFITKLYGIECNRLQSTTSRASINRFTLSFLDECDRVKVLMHLHSFTYDFHLRCIYNYVSNASGTYRLCERYHLTHFLDDFMKYYNKAPNFALNLVHADTLTIRNLMTEGKQLYDYLLANVSQYNFEVFIMNREEVKENEYVLVQVTNMQQVSYKDSQDRQHTDDFDITVIVCNICSPFLPWDNVLHLKYYLILTSRSEVYPKSDAERKLGKFRTVSYTRTVSDSEPEKIIDVERSTTAPQSSDTECETSTSLELPPMFTSTFDEVKMEKPEDTSSSSTTIPHVEIRQESVNYLGYYSSHEQLMQQLILDYAGITQKQIREMVTKGMVHCRTHLLWNKLVSCQESHTLTYAEFMELKGLARLQNLCDIQPILGSLLNQPLTWYQGLSKLLLTKYGDQNKTYVSADGNIQHYVFLHPRYVGAFMLLSMDLHTSRGDLYAVYREPHKYEETTVCVEDRKALLDGFINCVCFYLWSGMI